MLEVTANWPLINSLANELKVSEHARQKWRTRGIPYRWQLPLMERAKAGGQMLPKGIFNRPPKVKKRNGHRNGKAA